jgi:hypothetical protein
MLRWVVALLLLANLGFYAWTQGWLDPVLGTSAVGDREPERLSRQVRPEAVTLLSRRAGASASAGAAAPTATACLEAGPFDDPALPAVEDALRGAGVPADRWQATTDEKPGVWLVYMGRFPDRETLQRKRAELQRLRVAFEEVHSPADLDAGLSLGRFDDRAAADASLAQLTQRGVRTARVVALAPPQRQHLLRIDHAEPALQARLKGLKAPALAAGFRPCAAAAVAAG